MTPSVRQTIHEYFPSESEQEIQAILQPFGKGPSHARTAHAHVHMIYLSGGDKEELRSIVAQAVASPDDFDAGWVCYESWSRVLETFTAARNGMAFFAAIIKEIRPAAIRLHVRAKVSSWTVCLYGGTVAESLEAGLYLVPLPDGKVHVTREHTCIFAPKTDEVAELCPGQLLGEVEAVSAIGQHLEQVFGTGSAPR